MPIQIPVVQTGLERSIQEAATKAGKNLRINMGPGAKSIDALSQPLGRLTGKADEFTKSMEAANARVLAFGASVGVIAAVSRGFQELVRTTIDVEKNLANINSILKQSESQLNSFKDTIFDIARNTGQTFGTVAEAALELSRQGLKAEEVTKRLNDALVLSRLSGLSAADSVSGLTAAINSFSSAGLTSEQVLNKISAAAASAAVSDRDLIEGLKRSGSVAVASGVQFDELIGIIGALQERTARGGAVIGNSLKTIFTRIQDIEKLKTLQGLGVQVTDLEGKVLSSSKVIENLGPVFAKLSQTAKVNLADDLVGKFQIAPFLALLEDYNQKVSRSGEIAATSFNATNEAYQRNEALSKTLAAAINTATVNLKELANTLGEIGVTENLSKIIGVFNSVVSSIQGILDGDGIGSKFAKGLIKGIGSIIAGPGLALALVAIGKLLLDFAKFGAGALKTFFGLNAAAEAQKNLQGQIAASLLNDKGIRSAMLSIEKQNISEGEKKKLQTLFFTKALNEQLMLMQKMQGIAISIAPGVMAGTASARGGRRGRAAGGFLPIGAERSDISKGVGGSPSSAKPVVIPNFAFGGGRRGTMVANDSEYIVPNYANGGDAIFNQNMASSMGLPANARKVRAASGYIPNFANSVIAKAFNSKDQRVFLIEQIKKTNPNFKPTLKAAGGYIPNFAEGALENAIGREKGAGLPVSQIRINQSGKLRNSQNPMGLAVTNTRDEPTGAIPNFARNGVPSMGGMMTQTFQPTPAATVPPAAQRDLTGIFFALTAGMTGLQSATSDATSGIGKFGNMLSGSLQTVSAFAFAGSGIASAAQGATSGIGKFASKLGPASLAIGAVWGAFELGTNIIDEHSGANRRSADALARLKDSADQLALGFAHLTESQKYGIQKEAESIVNRRGPSENELGGLKSDYNADDIVQDGGVLRDLRDRKFGEDLIGDDKEIKQSFIDTAAAFRALGKNGEEIDDILDTYLSTLTGGEAVNFRDKYLEFKNSIDVVNTGFQKYLKTLDLEQLESLSKSSKRNFEEASFNKIPAALQDSFIKAAKGEASTAIDHKNEQFEQVSLTALKARVAAALELKKLQISLNTTAKDRLATAQALGNADLVALENLKANANKEQEKNEFAKNNLSFLQEYGEKLNNLGADADKLGAYEESISNKTVEQLTSAEFLKGVLAETLELKGIDKEQADLAVKNLQDQIDGSQKLYEQRLKNANVSENDLEIARKLLAIQSANTQSRIAQGLIQVESEENKSRSGNLVRDLEQSKRGATNASMREIDKKIASERLNEAQNQVITNNRDLSERVKQLMIQVKKVGAESDDGKGFLADVQKQSRLTKIANDELIANAEANKAAADAVGAIIPASILFKNLLDGLGQQRQDALAQAQFDVENLSNAGLTRQAAIRNDDSKFIKQYPNLPHELAIQVGSMNRGVSDRIAMGIPDALKSSDQLKQSLADASTGFAHNIGNAMVDAIAKGESLGDALLGTAAEFLNTISKAFMNKAVNDMMGTFFPTAPISS
jgi:TP901 family phage tail tape measure protein